MSQKIPQSIRNMVAVRANYCCEYCRIPEIDSYYGFQVDHILSRKHDGKTLLENLAYACPDCNRYKGSDLGTYLDDSYQFTRFFHPRLDDWAFHFETQESGLIIDKTAIGLATIKIFGINHPDRIIERKLLWQLNLLK
jgi:5-methylcytosine-specific restriction endonuclease McrA